MKHCASNLVSLSAVLVVLVLISEYAPRTEAQVHHRFSGWRPGGKKRSDAGEVNSNTINIDRTPQPKCQTPEERQIAEEDSDILGDLRRAATRVRLLELLNLSKTHITQKLTDSEGELDERPNYEDYLAAAL